MNIILQILQIILVWVSPIIDVMNWGYRLENQIRIKCYHDLLLLNHYKPINEIGLKELFPYYLTVLGFFLLLIIIIENLLNKNIKKSKEENNV